MKTIIELLNQNPRVSDYKINLTQKESYECFYVKGKLETVRCTDTCDRIVTVYVDYEEFKGDSQFYVYPSTTDAELAELIEKAADKAVLLNNKMYRLPENETGEFQVDITGVKFLKLVIKCGETGNHGYGNSVWANACVFNSEEAQLVEDNGEVETGPTAPTTTKPKPSAPAKTDDDKDDGKTGLSSDTILYIAIGSIAALLLIVIVVVVIVVIKKKKVK